MTSLKTVIEERLKNAMKARQEITVSTFRLLRAALKNKEIEIGKALDDAGIVLLVKKMIKQAEESIEYFKKGNRADLIKRATEEIAILKPMIPTQMEPNELKKEIQEIINQLGATSFKQMGAVMKSISEKLSGQADMKEASRIVRDILSSE